MAVAVVDEFAVNLAGDTAEPSVLADFLRQLQTVERVLQAPGAGEGDVLLAQVQGHSGGNADLLADQIDAGNHL